MDLSSILPKGNKKDEERELFWSIVIESDWVQAGVWEIIEESANLLSEGTPVAWKEENELIDCTDTALSGAASGLDDDSPDPEKVVFGVGASWIEEGNIKEDKLEILKNLCTKLSVKPAGFVVLSEAIAHLTKVEEGSPMSAVLIGISEENLEISVFRLGKLAGTQVVARSVSVSDDVLEGLVRFSSEDPLPSRFILYDGKESELEEVKEQIIQTDWKTKEKIKFLHAPKIEIFLPKDKVLATALAGAAEIAGVKNVFRKEKENEKQPILKIDEVENVATPDEDVDVEDVGFVVGGDVSKEPKMKVSDEQEEQTTGDIMPSKMPKLKKTFIKPGFLAKLSSLKEKLFVFLENFGAGGIKVKGPKKKNRLMVFGITSIIVLILIFVSWWFLPKSTVTIFVSPKKLQETVDVETGPDVESLNLEKSQIPGNVETVSQKGEKTKSTTGTKLVGDRAKGTVEVRNGTSDSIQLDVGDVLTGGNDLKFEVLESASVSAALNPGSPGTKSVEVEASDIGSEYNLAKDETFKVGSFDRAEVDAVATSDFSGGSSREISAVSKDDLEGLEEELIAELKESAIDEIKGKIPADEYLIEESLTSEVVSSDYSAKVGDEADTLALSLGVEVSGITVSSKDLFDLSKNVLEEETPEGYVLRENQINFVFEVKDVDKELYDLSVDIEANLLPEIKTDEIAKKIAGKKASVAETYLKSVPGYVRAQIILKPRLPGFLSTLPHVIKNVNVEVSAER